MKTIEINSPDGRIFKMNEEGKWRIIWEKFKLNDAIHENEVIDCLKKYPNLIRQYFPVHANFSFDSY